MGDSTVNLRLELTESAGESIFPAVLVYDKSKLTPSGGYGWQLPDTPQERSQVVLKAYIAPRQEISNKIKR